MKVDKNVCFLLNCEQLKLLKDSLQKGIDSLDNDQGIVADDRFYENIILRGKARLARRNMQRIMEKPQRTT